MTRETHTMARWRRIDALLASLSEAPAQAGEVGPEPEDERVGAERIMRERGRWQKITTLRSSAARTGSAAC